MYHVRRPSPYGDRRFMGNALSLLTDQIIAPEQFFTSSSENISGEKRLLYDLLIDAVECYLPRLHPRYDILPLTTKKLTEETIEWFSKGDVGNITFQFICDHLGKAPDSIRKHLEETWEKTNGYKQLFSFDNKVFSPHVIENSVRSYQEKTAIGVSHADVMHRRFFCYTMRSVTKPIMKYLQIGRFFDRGNPYATKMYKEFFLSYVEGVPELLGIAEDFYAHLSNGAERQAA